jgi:IMP dehydrogenase
MNTTRQRKIRKIDDFFAVMARKYEALGYNDVLLVPCYGDVLPQAVDLRTKITSRISGFIPVISSPMDTVTEGEVAVEMPRLGGMGIVHRNISPEAQAKIVSKAKHHLSAFVSSPICVRDSDTVAEVLGLIERKGYPFRSFLVKDVNGKVVGVVSSKEFDFCSAVNQQISQIMVTDIISARPEDDVAKAYSIMMDRRIKILPKFSDDGELMGIYTLADVKRIVEGSSANYNLAPDGTLRVGAAIGAISDESMLRMELLAKAGTDLVVIDTAKGNSPKVIRMIEHCLKHFPHIDVVAGNIATAEDARALADAGVHAVRVGVGPGSICSTRVISGVGVPQLTAVFECAKALRGTGISVWADGGIKYSGDITKALAAGADVVMLGNLLAGTTESPGDVIVLPSGTRLKVYRGMGSLGAMAATDRYGQAGSSRDKLVTEGVTGKVPYRGPLSGVIFQLLGGLKSGMGYCGAGTIAQLQENAKFCRITSEGLRESHPHDLLGFDPEPNYQG